MSTKYNAANGKFHDVHRYEKGLSTILDTLEIVSFENWLFRDLIDHGFQRIVFIAPKIPTGTTSILTFDEVSYYSFEHLKKFEDIYSEVEKDLIQGGKNDTSDYKNSKIKVERALAKLKEMLDLNLIEKEVSNGKQTLMSSRVDNIVKNTLNQVQSPPPPLGRWYSNASGALEGSEFLNRMLDNEIKYILFESKIKSAIVFNTGVFQYPSDKFKPEELYQAMRSWDNLINTPNTIHSDSVFIFVKDTSKDTSKVQKGLTDSQLDFVTDSAKRHPACISHQPKFDIETVKKFLFRELIRGRFSNEVTFSTVDLKRIESIAGEILNKQEGKSKSYPNLVSLIKFFNQEDESLMNVIMNSSIDYENTKPSGPIHELNRMIGLDEAKEAILSVIEAAKSDPENVERVYLFVGNPGTGKTEVARLFSRILYEEGLIKEKKFVEVSAANLTGPYQGDSLTITQKICESALNGLLFFDEIYTISENSTPNEQAMGKQIISTINKFIEDHSQEMFVVFAGYENKMPQLMKMNEGFESRVTNTVYFRNYTIEELTEICKLMISNKNYVCDEGYIEKFKEVINKNVRFINKSDRWGNAREVRKIVVKSIQKFNSSGLKNPHSKRKCRLLTAEHIDDTKRKRSEIELQKAVDRIMSMTGLNNVKREIDTILNNLKYLPHETKNLPRTLLFLGNPGTGKTEVARLLKDILYHAGVIQYDKLIEVSKTDLTGNLQGDTVKKPEEKCDEALGGVLFLDEIYTLDDGSDLNRGGKEIVSTIMKHISDNRDNMFVIFAGYKEDTLKLLGQNRGMKSRIQRVLEFENYSAEELLEIAIKHLNAENEALILTEGFKQALGEEIEHMVKASRNNKSFGNARDVIALTSEIMSNRANRYRRLASDGVEITEEFKRTLVAEDVAEINKLT